MRRNGVAHSDRARMIEQFVRLRRLSVGRHGCRRSRSTLDEPFVRSTDLQSESRGRLRTLVEFGGFVNGGEGSRRTAASDDVLQVRASRRSRRWSAGAVPSFMPGAEPGSRHVLRRGTACRSRRRSAARAYAVSRVHAAAARARCDGRRFTNARESPRALGRRPSRSDGSRCAAPALTARCTLRGQVWMVIGGRHATWRCRSAPEGVLVVNPGPAELADACAAPRFASSPATSEYV